MAKVLETRKWAKVRFIATVTKTRHIQVIAGDLGSAEKAIKAEMKKGERILSVQKSLF